MLKRLPYEVRYIFFLKKIFKANWLAPSSTFYYPLLTSFFPIFAAIFLII